MLHRLRILHLTNFKVFTRLKSSKSNSEKGFVPCFKNAIGFGSKIALQDGIGQYSYIAIYNRSRIISNEISKIVGIGKNERIAFLCPNDSSYLITKWGIWMSGNIAVPLSTKHPKHLLEYYIKDSKSKLLIAADDYKHLLEPISNERDTQLIIVDKNLPQRDSVNSTDECELEDEFYSNANALILYTSGTTGDPKGVVLSHQHINSQIECLKEAWEMSESDVHLHTLPLNHVHGTVNALLLPLSLGSKVIMLPKFNSKLVWSYLLHENKIDAVNVFMAVPTIYNFLIDEYQKQFSTNKRLSEFVKIHCTNKIRLMISGSAPLPVTVFQEWDNITGHRLLERYGMTEIGMALSNPYREDRIRKRFPGVVGQALPNVEIKIVDPLSKNDLYRFQGRKDAKFWSRKDLITFESDKNPKPSIIGDLYVRGPNVFSEYWNRPIQTKKEFTNDGWFKTGDTASVENDVLKILGRTSIDIIKSGGYKISAIEIENKIRDHECIADIAIVGLPDETWGQKLAAVIVFEKNAKEVSIQELKGWCATFLAPYTIPTIFKVVDDIPRNPMGKINKKQLIDEMFGKV